MIQDEYDKEIDIGTFPKAGLQITDPDWSQVKFFAEQAAEATIEGRMHQANDFYQHIAIEVMNALYGKDAVLSFLKTAMAKEKPENQRKIVLS